MVKFLSPLFDHMGEREVWFSIKEPTGVLIIVVIVSCCWYLDKGCCEGVG